MRPKQQTKQNGGARRNRTDDLLHAIWITNEVLINQPLSSRRINRFHSLVVDLGVVCGSIWQYLATNMLI